MAGVLAVCPGLTAAPSAEPPKHEELTVWVTSQLGSHIGSGYASTYLTNIRARTIGKEDARLKKAINSLDGLGMMPVKGFGLVPAAVAWQTDTRMRNLIQEQADTGLSYGELLMAHALAAKSKESFADVVAMRERTRTWGELARKLGVDPNVVVANANLASERILAVEFRSRHRQQNNNTAFTSANPHTQHAHHH